jgi:antitoxin component YwqK of YwqJK toxin-antitoxin module
MIHQEFHDNGKLKLEVFIINGKKEGKCTYYDIYGHIYKEEYYIDNILNGEYKEFYFNNKLKSKVFMNNGKKEGKYIEYSFMNNIYPYIISNYYNDMLNYEYLRYLSFGYILYNYIDNKLNGKVVKYINDKLVLRFNYMNDLLDGDMYIYNYTNFIDYKISYSYMKLVFINNNLTKITFNRNNTMEYIDYVDYMYILETFLNEKIFELNDNSIKFLIQNIQLDFVSDSDNYYFETPFHLLCNILSKTSNTNLLKYLFDYVIEKNIYTQYWNCGYNGNSPLYIIIQNINDYETIEYIINIYILKKIKGVYNIDLIQNLINLRDFTPEQHTHLLNLLDLLK